MKDTHPAIDAEKIGSEQIKNYFRTPPCIKSIPGRSTLLIGTRGSGKTMLLRLMRHTYPGLAVYGDLGRKVLNALSSDTGGAGLSFDCITPGIEELIQNKAMALLSLWLVEQCQRQNLEPSFPLLRRILPKSLRNEAPGDRNLVDWLGDSLYSSDLTLYRGSSKIQIFLDFVYDLAEQAQNISKYPLLLLLDRAEEIPYPSLVPVLSLLDQSHPFLCVIACRPGILGPIPDIYPSLPIPGDHYDVKHLGMMPYSEEWRQFQIAVMQSWIPNCVSAIPHDMLDVLLNITRDVIRVGLSIVYESVNDDGVYDHMRSLSNIQNSQIMLLHAVQGKLRRLNDDIPSLLRRIRRENGFMLPVLLEVRANAQPPLFGSASGFYESTKDEQFIRLGLRSGLLATPNGVSWHPFLSLKEVELQPLYIWKEGDKWR